MRLAVPLAERTLMVIESLISDFAKNINHRITSAVYNYEVIFESPFICKLKIGRMDRYLPISLNLRRIQDGFSTNNNLVTFLSHKIFTIQNDAIAIV